MKDLKKLGRDQGGFTLTEVLVGILVLVTAIVASSNLLVSMIHSNATNMSTLQAYYYTQEGLEAFRNMRDTHFLNNVDFCGGKEANFWGKDGGFSSGCESTDGLDYAINVKKDPSSSVVVRDGISAAAPWELSTGDSGSGEVKFLDGSSGTEEPTGFTRKCMVEKFIGEDGVVPASGRAFKVTCTTSWEQNSDTKKVSISAILTDWKDE